MSKETLPAKQDQLSFEERKAERTRTQNRGDRISIPRLEINKGNWSNIPSKIDKTGDMYIVSGEKDDKGKWTKTFVHLGKTAVGTILAIRENYSRWNNDIERFDIYTNEFDPTNDGYPVGYKIGNEMIGGPIKRKNVKEFNVKNYPDKSGIDRGFPNSSQLKWKKIFYILIDVPSEKGKKKTEKKIVKHIINYKSNENWFGFDGSLTDIRESYSVVFGSDKQKGKQVSWVTTFGNLFEKVKGKNEIVKHGDKETSAIFDKQDELEETLALMTANFFGMSIESLTVTDDVPLIEQPKEKQQPAAGTDDDGEDLDDVNLDDVNV